MKKRIKIRKKTLPLKKMSSIEKDYTAGLLENIYYDFKAFGEVLSDVQRKGDATFEEVGRINERLTSFEFVQKETNKRLTSLEDTQKETNKRLTLIEKELISIKNEIKNLYSVLSKKTDIEKLTSLELRVINIEKHLRLVA